MKKLRLDYEDLKVESFGTQDGGGEGGTVMARDGDTYPESFGFNCQSYEETCYNRGCGGGLTSMCGTGQATDCPGQTDCARYTDGHTCASTCTDVQACTFCGAVC
jgi:hypothetical protein